VSLIRLVFRDDRAYGLVIVGTLRPKTWSKLRALAFEVLALGDDWTDSSAIVTKAYYCKRFPRSSR